MTQYEYKNISVKGGDKELCIALNKHGLHGWKPIHIENYMAVWSVILERIIQ